MRSGPRRLRSTFLRATVLLGLAGLLAARPAAAGPRRVPPAAPGLLPTEKLAGRGVWIDPRLEQGLLEGVRLRATIWFEDQFLGDGGAYARRAEEFRSARRTELGPAVVRTLKWISERSWATAKDALEALQASGGIRNVDRFWIVNGFACGVTADGLARLAEVPGVRKVFRDTSWRALPPAQGGEAPRCEPVEERPFEPSRYRHPWYARYLLADRVWSDLGVAGEGTLNVVHDHNFVFSPHVTPGVYHNPGEVPGNGEDDDGNGLVDDVHGFNFDRGNQVLTTIVVPPAGGSGAALHGFRCSAILCGRGAEGAEHELGVAPRGTWAGVISARRMEAAVQWAVEQGADTYSMSFSVPDRGEHRSHWRKLMEHGSFCGVCFVSGAGNFGLTEQVPVQMRQPEDIPNAVFAAAGVHRDLSRTPTSSQGPVAWNTEHYRDGVVPKPAICAFNADLPMLYRDGTVREGGLGGNSFAGPMLCGAIALMRSADPDLLPWDVREILTSTATDVAARGVDAQTGHGLVNCYRAVKEVLYRKATREGRPAERFRGRTQGDELDLRSLEERLQVVAVVVGRLGPKGQARALGVQVGDVLVAYDGKPIGSREALREGIRTARDAGAREIALRLRRGEETREITVAPGPLGLRAVDRYAEPVFE